MYEDYKDYGEYFVDVIRDMGFPKFVQLSKEIGKLSDNPLELEAFYLVIIDKLVENHRYDLCCYLRDKYEEYKKECSEQQNKMCRMLY